MCKDCETHRYPVSVKLEHPESKADESDVVIVSKFTDGREERITVEQCT